MDGIIVINKEQGYTSNDVVQIIKKKLNEKVGHTGTLDPMATGVLPILVGKGTKCSKYILNHDKIYTATLKLGIKTDTGDITGNIIKEEKNLKNIIEIVSNVQEIKKVLKSFEGEISQIPPMYSAIKVKGKKLYEYARSGQTVEISPRNIKIYNIELINTGKDKNNEKNDLKEDEIIFRVKCSKGTYIRTLCEDIAEKLGTIGTMSKLNREKVGDFSIEDAIKLEDFDEKFEKGFISIEKFLENYKKIILTPRSYISFINGVKLLTDDKNGIYRIYDINENFIGTGLVNNGILKRDVCY